MNVLVTGATGFIGRHLLEAMKNDNVRLRLLTRRADAKFDLSSATIVHGDLSATASLEPAFENLDVVVNLAAELRDGKNYEQTNIRGVVNVARLAKQNNVRVVHLSSVGVTGMQYSAKRIVVDEQTPCAPKNEYERTKLRSEEILNEAFGENSSQLVILRPTNVFGDAHPREALLRFLQSVKNRKPLVCTKDAMVNYVYVKDLAQVIRHFTLGKSAGVFNVGQTMLFLDFLRASAKLLSVEPRCTVLPRLLFALPEALGHFGKSGLRANLRSLSNRVEYSDARLLAAFPQAYPFGTLKGLERTIEYYKSKGVLG